MGILWHRYVSLTKYNSLRCKKPEYLWVSDTEMCLWQVDKNALFDGKCIKPIS